MNKTLLQINNISVMEGDIFQTTLPTLVCTVNTNGVMGKGIALAVRNRWPEVYDQYRNHCMTNPYVFTHRPNLYRGGDIAHCWVDTGMETTKPTGITEVLCFATKEQWRKPSELEWIERGMINVYCEYELETNGGLAFPMLGCANGGLQWKDVYPIMMKYLSLLKVPVEIYVTPQEAGRIHEWANVNPAGITN